MEPQQNTVAALRSRVEQQSTLIAMLKQRGDTTLAELTESQTKCELLSARVDSLQQKLFQEEAQSKQLGQRFTILAKNHEEMIRIKDEYKQANHDLQAKHRTHLSKNCERCERLEKELLESNMALSESGQRCATLEGNCLKQQSRIKSLEEELQSRNKSAEEWRESQTQRINHCEQQLSRLRAECQNKDEYNQKLQSRVRRLEADEESITKELTSLQSLLSQYEQTLKASLDKEKEMQESFRLRSDEVSKDAIVKKLREKLLETEEKLLAIEKEFSAYKKHSSQLLAHERELNSKLRHILD